MFINSIILRNFRIYKGEHTITFPKVDDKNVFIISGDNGFGKTTLMTALIWCLYGKLIGDVDDKYKKEITDHFGYKNYAKANLNKSLHQEFIQLQQGEQHRSPVYKKTRGKNSPVGIDADWSAEYSVAISFSNILIPSMPCSEISITRTYDVIKESETVKILIDGKENELTRDVGPEVFINDFILSREIAKFFFFDSEKIVTLAELKTKEEKRKLSFAYSEVLGLKKYEDLKTNLESLRIKYRRRSADIVERNKLEKITKEYEDLVAKAQFIKGQIGQNDIVIQNNRQVSEQFQEKLIREGNKISLSELQNLKKQRDETTAKDIVLKSKIKDLLDLAPFAISGKKLIEVYDQMRLEKKHSQVVGRSAIVSDQLKSIQNELLERINKNPLIKESSSTFIEIINQTFTRVLRSNNSTNESFKILFDFSLTEQNEFQSIYDNIRYSFSVIFKQLIKDYRVNRNFLTRITNKISAAETDDNDLRVKEYRQIKSEADKTIVRLEKENRSLSEQVGSLEREITSKSKLRAELSRKVSVDESDEQKDKIAERLIAELAEFIVRLKSDKKKSLETSIKYELNKLMHKKGFVDRVDVDINGDIIEIHLFDKAELEIRKENLSKGEQQLYATSILKALVDESGLKFPIFIDSPLQKFDKRHSKKIITEFYPSISEQVVVFPLLGKELIEEEYNDLLTSIQCSYIIQNDSSTSYFTKVEPAALFSTIKKSYVHSH